MRGITRLLSHLGLEGPKSVREGEYFEVGLAFFGTFPLRAFANSYAAQAELLKDAVYSLASAFLMASVTVASSGSS